MEITADLDMTELMSAIRIIPMVGRRTVQEQCVTSSVFIARRTQQLMPAVNISLIDAELQVEVSGVTKGGKASRSKNPHKRLVSVRSDAKPVALGVRIIMARGNPQSEYSQRTGNRWPLTLPGQGKGYRQRIGDFVKEKLSKMTLTRHSSTHFILTGWTPVIREGIASPLYRYNAAFGTRRSATAIPNRRNTINPAPLGGITIDIGGDACIVTSENAVGSSGSTAKLRESYTRAREQFGRPALVQAIGEETRTLEREIMKRLEEGLKAKLPALLT